MAGRLSLWFWTLVLLRWLKFCRQIGSLPSRKCLRWTLKAWTLTWLRHLLIIVSFLRTWTIRLQRQVVRIPYSPVPPIISALAALESLVIWAALLQSLIAMGRELPADMAQLTLLLALARWHCAEQLSICLPGRVTS